MDRCDRESYKTGSGPLNLLGLGTGPLPRILLQNFGRFYGFCCKVCVSSMFGYLVTVDGGDYILFLLFW
jgi:hypothetical protein